MFLRARCLSLLIGFNLSFSPSFAQSNEPINFCGEIIPLERDFVHKKLMGVINNNKKNIDLDKLRKKSNYYFPFISNQLSKYGIPDDFKYLPIIESGFSNATSKAGAHGFWQIMPGTAQDLGLKVKREVDERNNVIKSTIAACKHIRSLYAELGSWTLVACAYNFGLGNVRKTIKAQRKSDYYQMRLNSETALYLYRIIAIKQLFTGQSDTFFSKVIESKPDNEDFNQVSFQIKSSDNRFLKYVDRALPLSANIFIELVEQKGETYGKVLNDCDMFGFIVKKGTLVNLKINKGEKIISASVENIPDLYLMDLSGSTSIEALYFKPGLVLKATERN